MEHVVFFQLFKNIYLKSLHFLSIKSKTWFFCDSPLLSNQFLRSLQVYVLSLISSWSIYSCIITTIFEFLSNRSIFFFHFKFIFWMSDNFVESDARSEQGSSWSYLWDGSEESPMKIKYIFLFLLKSHQT